MDLLAPSHLIIILIVALVVFGPKKLPELGRGLGRGMRDFKDAMSGDDDAIRRREAADEAAEKAAELAAVPVSVTAATAVEAEPTLSPTVSVASSAGTTTVVVDPAPAPQSTSDFYASAEEPLLSPPSPRTARQTPVAATDEPTLSALSTPESAVSDLASDAPFTAEVPDPADAPERPSAPSLN